MVDNKSLAPYLTQFKSHKIVRAAKIRYVMQRESGNLMVALYTYNIPYPESQGVEISSDILARVPNGISGMAGGYLVLYENNYLSWSPADVFENGYTRLSEVKKPKLYLLDDGDGHVVLSAFSPDENEMDFERNHVEVVEARTARCSAEDQMPSNIFKQVLANVLRQAGIEIQVE